MEELIKRYRESHRHYHTLDHIYDCLHLLSEFDLPERENLNLREAIWFHDAVYDPLAKDNEERSAEMARLAMSSPEYSDEDRDTVESLIMVTKGHSGDELTYLQKVMVCVDLAILGETLPRYVKYAMDIRKEYSAVPWTDYRKGRLKVLKSFLYQDLIYPIPEFGTVREYRAKDNIELEINLLEVRGDPLTHW